MDDQLFSNPFALPLFPEIRFGADDAEDPEEDDPENEDPEGADDDEISLEEWLQNQPEEVQKRFNAQRTDLKTSLQKERKLRRDAQKKLRETSKARNKEDDDANDDALAQAKREAAEERAKREQLEAERNTEKLRLRFLRAVRKSGKAFTSERAEDLAFEAFDKDLAAEGDDGFEEALEAVFEDVGVLFTKEIDPRLENDGRRKGGPKIDAAEEVAKRKQQKEGSSYHAI